MREASSDFQTLSDSRGPALIADLVLGEIAPGGDAVGRRDDGLVVFVPGGAPGDRVRVALSPPKKGFARGQLLEVLTPGPSRITPACALSVPDRFGARCGGCPLMLVDRQAQLAAKQSFVGRALRKIRVDVRPILAPVSPLGYRLRARLVVRAGRLGFATDRSHGGVSTGSCAVLEPALDRVLFARCAAIAPQLGEGATVQGLYGEHAGQPAVQLFLRLGAGAQRKKVQALLSELLDEGAICGFILEDGQSRVQSGAPTLNLGAGSPFGSLLGAADRFAQASAAGHDTLPGLVAAALGGLQARSADATLDILELYSGSGNLTRALRELKARIVCIEGDFAAAKHARALFPASSTENESIAAKITIDARSVETALMAHRVAGDRFDAVLLDPPRSGAKEILSLICALSPQRIIYVSCDAMTLGRDLETLERFGYQARSVQPIDLMPQTAEVECVAILDAVTAKDSD